MDEDDQVAAEAHQQELEQREREEQIERGWLLLADSRRGAKEFEVDMHELNEQIETNWREFYGDHG